jgi:alkanesulfonate monooxygenase SsuD/methylene tetrahydromethanopterin reductase-like flavin-dependent oxidoreductase (luciferase family)
MGRMGFEEDARRIQDLFLEDRREEAAAAVPDQFADEISLVGPVERIRDRLDAWRGTPVTTLLIANQDRSVLRKMAELVLG